MLVIKACQKVEWKVKEKVEWPIQPTRHDSRGSVPSIHEKRQGIHASKICVVYRVTNRLTLNFFRWYSLHVSGVGVSFFL